MRSSRPVVIPAEPAVAVAAREAGERHSEKRLEDYPKKCG
jgi:hypothetical protein